MLVRLPPLDRLSVEGSLRPAPNTGVAYHAALAPQREFEIATAADYRHLAGVDWICHLNVEAAILSLLSLHILRRNARPSDGWLAEPERLTELRQKLLFGNQFLGLRRGVLPREQLRAQRRIPELRFIGGPSSPALPGDFNDMAAVAQYSAVSSLAQLEGVRNVEKAPSLVRQLGHVPFVGSQAVYRKTIRHSKLLA